MEEIVDDRRSANTDREPASRVTQETGDMEDQEDRSGKNPVITTASNILWKDVVLEADCHHLKAKTAFKEIDGMLSTKEADSYEHPNWQVSFPASVCGGSLDRAAVSEDLF
ncbi:hypothetical protein F2P79_023508 [Pimephales promelas]|nr:hypothetical protein F2P79_023508 [Pimephales promelas]